MCTVRFFDSTPSGRILNRLSRDVQVIDENIPTSGMYWTYEVLATLGILIVIFLNLPAFLLAGVVIAVAYVFLGYLYVTASRELKRLGESPTLRRRARTMCMLTLLQLVDREHREIADLLRLWRVVARRRHHSSVRRCESVYEADLRTTRRQQQTFLPLW